MTITPELVEKCRLLALAAEHLLAFAFVGGLLLGWVCIVAKACVLVLRAEPKP